MKTALEDAKVADTDAAVYKQIWEYSDNTEIFEIVLRKERNTMNTVLKRLGALVLAAILIAGMVPAMETRAASLVRTFAALIPCLFVMTALFSGYGLWSAWPAAELISLIVTAGFLRKYREKYEYA